MLSLLVFGGETLRDFAFALMVGILSGAYSSIFIASPVLTHWKERERVYTQRSERIRRESGGLVPAYAMATVGGEPVEVAPPEPRRRRRPRRLTAPDEPEEVSKRGVRRSRGRASDVGDEPVRARVAPRSPSGRTSTLVDADGHRARPTPKKRHSRAKPKRPRNRRHGRNRYDGPPRLDR